MKKAHLAVLRNISQSIPKELTDKLLKTVKVSPSWEKDAREYLDTGTTKNKLLVEKFQDNIEALRNMFDAGIFSKTIEMTDPKVEKAIDEYLTTKIEQAKKDGLLPHNTDKLLKKTKQHGKRVHRQQNQTGGDSTE